MGAGLCAGRAAVFDKSQLFCFHNLAGLQIIKTLYPGPTYYVLESQLRFAA